MIVSNIEVNGKKYKLQHPGNREWIRLKKTLISIDVGKTNIDLEPLLDYAFEHVIFPEEGNKLNLDTIELNELEEVWGVIIPQFFRGELETGGKFKTKKWRKN